MKVRAALLIFAISVLTGCTAADKDYIREHVVSREKRAPLPLAMTQPARGNPSLNAAQEALPGH